ncbi:hypothetical protein HPP92_020483 [Vanilla planifolia]|uniref:Cation/H+ exchanger transmembrane domain-containing protein n=1 Tax=Vanilla planifolia TaxID=51239 RepID=A0A835UHM9_VANPL|nr:hypothetical protein HPP92_020483 [Vanilla planifolia]
MDLAYRQFGIASYGCPGSGALDSRFRPGVRGYSGRIFCRLRAIRRDNGVTASQCRVKCSVRGAHFDNFARRRWPLAGCCGNPRKIWMEMANLQCQGNDSIAYISEGGQDIDVTESHEISRPESLADGSELASGSVIETGDSVETGKAEFILEDSRELLQSTVKELEVARLNSTMFEQKAQSISESAIALKDVAESAWKDVPSAVSTVQEIINEETTAKEAVQKATMSLSMAEARLRVAMGLLDPTEELPVMLKTTELGEDKEGIRSAQEVKECKVCLENCEAELKLIQRKKEEMQKEIDKLSEFAEKSQLNALKAEEEVNNIMLLAEQAVAFELDVAQRVNDAELALQKAEKVASSGDMLEKEESPSLEPLIDEAYHDVEQIGLGVVDAAAAGRDLVMSAAADVAGQNAVERQISDDLANQENGTLSSYANGETELEAKSAIQVKKQEIQQKDSNKDSTLSASKGFLKKSSRFFSASFFSFVVEGKDFTAASIFQRLVTFAKKQAPRLILGSLLLGMGAILLSSRLEKNYQLLQQPDIISSIEEVTSTTLPVVQEIKRFPRRLKRLIALLPKQEINEEEASLFDMLWLLLASVIFVPIFQKIPGGSPVLGYLAAGILIGPYGMSIIRNVHETKAIAEFGVVFLLFNIGLELSVERLSSMKKYVFGLGSTQVFMTAAVVGLATHFIFQLPGPAAIVIGNGLALSSTAVVLQSSFAASFGRKDLPTMYNVVKNEEYWE